MVEGELANSLDGKMTDFPLPSIDDLRGNSSKFISHRGDSVGLYYHYSTAGVFIKFLSVRYAGDNTSVGIV